MSDRLAERIEDALPEVVRFRRDMHAHPELSRQEFETSGKVRDALAKLPGVKVLKPLTDTDVIALLNADRDGPCVALRADMDALPINEETDVEYKSTVSGTMHACGHDGHTSILLGTATVLSQMADELPGKIKFIFQPDEEDTGGGERLCERGVLESPRVDAAFALHGWPGEPVGTIAIRSGEVMAANSKLDIMVRGRSGHGAYPHRAIDPIMVAAHIVTALQTVVSRNVDPLDAGVVTIGHIAGGHASNVIPETCHMTGTIRYTRPGTGERIRHRIQEVARHTAQSFGAEADVEIKEGYPAMHNDVDLTHLVEDTASSVLGADHVITDLATSMGVEDFAFYAQRVPAAIFRLGIRPESMETYPGLHNARFNFNDEALPVGIRMFCEITRRFLSDRGG